VSCAITAKLISAYNAGVAGAMTWEPVLVAKVFDASAELMAQYQQLTTLDNDPELPVQRATAMFACFCGNCKLSFPPTDTAHTSVRVSRHARGRGEGKYECRPI
jgi:hypothetical protein